MQHSKQVYLVLSINRRRFAAVSAAISKDEFIAHQRLTPVPFIPHRAHTRSAITVAAMQAQHIAAFVFIARCVYNCSENAYGRKCGKQYVADMFHNLNLEKSLMILLCRLFEYLQSKNQFEYE